MSRPYGRLWVMAGPEEAIRVSGKRSPMPQQNDTMRVPRFLGKGVLTAACIVAVGVFIYFGFRSVGSNEAKAAVAAEQQGNTKQYTIPDGLGGFYLHVWKDPEQGITCYIASRAMSCVKTGTTRH